MAMRPLPTQMTQIIVATTYFEFLLEKGQTMALYLRKILNIIFDNKIPTVGNTETIFPNVKNLFEKKKN